MDEQNDTDHAWNQHQLDEERRMSESNEGMTLNDFREFIDWLADHSGYSDEQKVVLVADSMPLIPMTRDNVTSDMAHVYIRCADLRRT